MKIESPHRMIMTPVATRLLADRAYDIEFHGFLSNHAKHAVVALDRLGATEERTMEYWDMYTSLTPYNLQLHKVDQDWDGVKPCTMEEWKEWRGQKKHWQEQVMFVYEKLQDKYNGDTNALISEIAPDLLLSPSLAGALMHGVIHLGFALDADSLWMTAEGLAYLNFCAIGVDPQVIRMDVHMETSPMETLIRASQAFDDDNLSVAWIQQAKEIHEVESFRPELATAGFQREVAKVMANPHPIARDMPSWLTNMDIPELFESLYRTVTLLYLGTKDEHGTGSFLILHLITSLWGLEHVLQSLSKTKADEVYDSIVRTAVAQWWANLICFLAASGIGIPPASALKEMQNGPYGDAMTDAPGLDWSAVVKNAHAETEEHNIKLVYVTQALWHRYGYWHPFFEAANSFTVTPNIGPSTPQYDP
jgi:hypothetical protein